MGRAAADPLPQSARADAGAFVPGPRAYRLGAPGGPLARLRLAVKDLFDLEGTVTGGGNPDWARAAEVADRSAVALAALLAAGADCVGKTITDELAFSLEGRNHHYGTPRNTRYPDALPGGSSSGSAAAVAAGAADIGLGSDTGGSVRVPGAFCGLWAMRPTHGRVPVAGLTPFAPGYDTVGWLTRDAGTLAAVGGVLLGEDATPAPIDRVLLAEDALQFASPDVADALHPVADALGAPGARVFPGRWEDSAAAYAALQAEDIRTALGPRIAAVSPRFGPDIAERFAAALDPQPGLDHHRTYRRAARARLVALLPPGTALLIPTAPVARLPRDADGAALGQFYRRALALSAVAGHAGAPQIHLPAGRVGFSVVSAPGTDRALIDFARQLGARAR